MTRGNGKWREMCAEGREVGREAGCVLLLVLGRSVGTRITRGVCEEILVENFTAAHLRRAERGHNWMWGRVWEGSKTWFVGGTHTHKHTKRSSNNEAGAVQLAA